MSHLFAKSAAWNLGQILMLMLSTSIICIYAQPSASRTLPHVIEHPRPAQPQEPHLKSQPRIKEAEQDLQRAQDAYNKAQQQNEYYKNNEPNTIQRWQSENELGNTQQSIRNAEGNLYWAQRQAESALRDRKLTEQNLDTQKRRQNNILRSYPKQYHGRR